MRTLIALLFVSLCAGAAETLEDTRMVPMMEPHSDGKQISGFKMIELDEKSVYAKNGFKKNDVIKTINGEKIDSPTKAMELFNVLKSGKTAKVIVERDGKEQELSLKAK